LVELALARQSRDNETEINEPISIPNAATFLRIQGQILETFRKNKSSSLECDESDNFDSGEENHIDFDDSMKDLIARRIVLDYRVIYGRNKIKLFSF
jgi:hypothetical protein